MTLFNDAQKQVIRDYVFRNDELFERIWRPEYHRIRFEELYGHLNLNNDERDLRMQEVIVNDEVITRVYVLKKWKNQLVDFFEEGNNFLGNHYINDVEKKLLYDYIGRRDESHENQTYTEAILLLSGLIETNSLHKLFEDSFDENFLLPSR